MTAKEIQSLDLARLGDALAETMVAIVECGREAITARTTVASVRTAWLRRGQPGQPVTTKDEHLALLEEARAIQEMIAIRARSLRELKSTLQTLIRAHV